MITEDYVSFENAKLLKEKGFDEGCDKYYPIKGGEVEELTLDELNYHRSQFIKAPTHQMAMRWLREVHKIDIVVMPAAVVDDTFKPDIMICPVFNGQYEWMCMRGNGTAAIFGYNINKCFCNSHEAACEAAIQYCLTNLI